MSSLAARLTGLLGSAQAASELKWMAQAANASSASPGLAAMVQRRLAGEPLQYILGSQPFGPLEIVTKPPVLIPRPETEEWTLRLASTLSPTIARPMSMLDLGTGTGCIPLLLCHLWPPGSLHADGVDISQEAVRLATENASRSGIPSTSADRDKANTFRAIYADYTNPHEFLRIVRPQYDLVTANPPYISQDEYDELPSSVKDFEDRRALHGGQDGLYFYRQIAHLLDSTQLLTSKAVVAFEIGYTQAEPVKEIMQKIHGINHTHVWKDAWGKDRTIVASKSQEYYSLH